MSTDAVKEAGMASMPSDHVPQHNNGVDYVIRYRFGGEGMGPDSLQQK